MKTFWAERAEFYGDAHDLEEKSRMLAERITTACVREVKDAFPGRPFRILELGCGNGKIVEKLLRSLPHTAAVEIIGVDYSPEMIEFARKRLASDSRVSFVVSGISDYAASCLSDKKKFDIVICINTLHNLPDRGTIFATLHTFERIVRPNGYLLLDIRNGHNPFIWYGYWRNRRRGLSFWTLTYHSVVSLMARDTFDVKKAYPIFYEDVSACNKVFRNSAHRMLYRIYLWATRWKIFAPYIFIAAQKKQREFISVIWGYHEQIYNMSQIENYHLSALEVARSAGYKLSAIMLKEHAAINKDPAFFGNITVVRYKNAFQYLFFLIRKRDALVYANSLVWQSLIAGLLGKHTVFMAHDSVRRKTKRKQNIQDFLLRFFSSVRVISEEEKRFLQERDIKERKIAVIPLALDNEIFRKENEDYRGRQGIVFLGNVTVDKNIETILKALQVVKSSVPNVEMHIIGEIRDPRFHEMLASFGLEQNVKTLGFIPQAKLSCIMNKDLIYVNASISEGQCLAAFEASLCGLGLCLPDTLSFTGVFRDMALFHGVYDYRTLAAHILLYTKDRELVAKHNKKARQYIIMNYSRKNIDEKLETLFTSICE